MMTVQEFKIRFMPLQQKLYTAAYRIMGSSQDAEDIVQEAYIKLWQQRDSIPLDGNLTGFCVTLTKNLCRDKLRRLHLEIVDDEPQESSLMTARDAEQELTERESYVRLMAVINQLSPPQRRVILMHDVEGMENAEIASLTGYTEVNIRVLLSRARKYVRGKMEEGRRDFS